MSRAEVISYHRGGAKLYQQSRSKSVTGFENSRTLKFKVSGFGALPTGTWVSRNKQTVTSLGPSHSESSRSH